MTVTGRLTGGVTLALLPLAAAADVTGDDVWANLQAYASAFGGVLQAGTSRTGDTLTVNDILLTFTFPQDLGEAVIGLSGVAMIDNADGTVSVLYAENPTLTLSGLIAGEGDGSARLTLRPASYTITASGDPGDVTYDSRFSDVTFDLEEVRSSEIGDQSAVSPSLDLTFDGWTSTSRVTEGDLLAVTGTTQMQPYRYRFLLAGDGFEMDQSGSAGASEASYSFALPAEGSDPMALGAAFDRGMFFEVSSRIAGQESRARMVVNGEVLQDQSSVQQAGEARLRIDDTALDLSGTIDGIEMSYAQTYLPFPFAADLARLTADIRLPMSASADPQPFRYAFAASGLRLGAGIWAQIDPDKRLPRDPADLGFDLSGEVIADLDLTDMNQWMSAKDAAIFPYRPTRVELTEGRAAALGALAEAAGAFSFDWTDLTTIPDLPRPEGEGTLTLTGVSALMDLMVSVGAMTPDDAMGLRMGLAMFTEASGPDQVRSTLSFDAAGGMTVNGQRIR